MLPASFQTPAAIILVLGGLLSCFAGYRVFRVVLGFFGFVLVPVWLIVVGLWLGRQDQVAREIGLAPIASAPGL